MLPLTDNQALGVLPVQGKIEAIFKWIKDINRGETDTIPPYSAKEINKAWRKKMLAVCDGNGKISVMDLHKSQTKIYQEKFKIFKEQLDKGLITKEQFSRYLSELNDAMIRNQL